MDVTRCDCCDLPSDQCGRVAEQRAAEDRRRQVAAALARPNVTAAGYAGACPCGEPIRVGDPIRAAARAGNANVWQGVLCCGAT